MKVMPGRRGSRYVNPWGRAGSPIRLRGSAAHIREWEASVICTELGEHHRLDLGGIGVLGDAPADEHFIVIGELPNSSPARVCDRHSCAVPTELVQPFA